MPKIVTNGTNVPALLTAGPDCSTLPCKVAQFYRVAGVEMTFAPGIESTGALVNVGDDWISDPQHIKPGNLMPQMPLQSDELIAIHHYLEQLK